MCGAWEKGSDRIAVVIVVAAAADAAVNAGPAHQQPLQQQLQ